MEIIRATHPEQILAASHLFDQPATKQWAELFLNRQGHHLLLAYEDNEVAGFISGIEMVHPDKGVEMFLYELAVMPKFQQKGIGAALVRSLADGASKLGCYDMWVLTDDENEAAIATYTSTGGVLEPNTRLILWDFEARGKESNKH